jgi:hypothetical protein
MDVGLESMRARFDGPYERSHSILGICSLVTTVRNALRPTLLREGKRSLAMVSMQYWDKKQGQQTRCVIQLLLQQRLRFGHPSECVRRRLWLYDIVVWGEGGSLVVKCAQKNEREEEGGLCINR